MILYDYNSNVILSKPLKTRQASELTTAWSSLHEQLQTNGYAPELHILDNECSDKLKRAFKKYNVAFQCFPPHVHRRNATERAIQTWKNHFCLGPATCDPKFVPLTEWDLLVPQADITLNLLRSSRRQPNLSAYACLNGNFDFNQSPLAPPGTHITPAQPSVRTWNPTASMAGMSAHPSNTTDATNAIYPAPSASAMHYHRLVPTQRSVSTSYRR